MVIDNNFAEVWCMVYLKGGTRQDVANVLGCTIHTVYEKELRMRKIGIKLPVLNKKES